MYRIRFYIRITHLYFNILIIFEQLNGKSRTDLKPNVLINNDHSQEDLFINEAIRIIKSNSVN